MKSKLFRIFGVVTTVAVLVSMLSIAPALALTQPTVALTGVGTGVAYTISHPNQYVITFTAGAAVAAGGKINVAFPATTNITQTGLATVAATGGAYTLPGVGKSFVITDTSAAPTVVATGGAFTLSEIGDSFVITAVLDLTATLPAATTGAFAVTFPAGTTGAYAAGVITFGTSLTATVTATANTTAGTWTRVLTATAAAGTDVLDTATLTITSGTLGVAFSAGGTYTPATGVIAFTVIGSTATVTSITAGAGTWARTVGLPTAAVTATTTDVVIQVLAGIGGGPIGSTSCAATITGTYPAAQTLSITVPAGGIGAGSLVGLTIGAASGIVNPTAAGTYTLTVATTTGATPAVTIEAAATSASYTIINPALTTLPGLVQLYNPNNILLWQNNINGSVKAAVDQVIAAGVTGYTITLGPGLYIEAATINLPAAATGVTIKASGAVADTIVPATWTLTGAHDVSFKGLTLETNTAGAAGTVIDVGAASDNVIIDGCTFVRSGIATDTGAQKFIVYNNVVALGVGAITNNTFDATLAAVADSMVEVGAGALGLTISKNTFKPDLTAAYASDTCITTAGGISATSIVTISENTFTGTSGFGYGVYVTGGFATITKNTFTGLFRVLNVNGAPATVTFTANTVTGSGSATTGLLAAALRVQAVGAGTVTITNNSITGGKYYIAEVAADDNLVFINFNTFTTNAYGLNNTDTSPLGLNATNNWWGAATGPAAGANSASVTATPYLGAAPSNGVVAIGVAVLDAKATTGVIVNFLKAGLGATMDAADIIGIATYAANPGATAPSSTLKVGKYFDVYALDVDGDADTVQILLYGTLNAFSEAWVYSPFAGTWVKCSNQSLNTTSGFIAVNVTATSTPSLVDLRSTPFVVVEAPPAAPGSTPAVQSPALGATNIPIDTTFTWPAVVGAVSYEFEIAEEIGQTDKFYLKDEVGSSAVSAFKLVDTLKYDTQYWWRVRAVNSLGVKSAFTTSFFTTAKEPVVVVPTPPVVVTTNPPPQITLEIPPAQVTKVEPIPAYLLWAVIAVGAILVIAVIVLIVRTRRIS